ncbi:MAG: peptidoglycan DD-metalloendopeptidase family protein, partial [Ruminococcus sp.]|nr:peptidoglycan DD-metalloendopeptidase family protein [Ruminococcus sp.]
MKKILTICLAVALLASFLITANAKTISEMEAEKEELQSQQDQIQSEVDSKNAEVAQQQGEVDAIVEQVKTVTEDINACNDKITALEDDIAEKQKLIDAANVEIEANMDVLRQRIKTIYISGDVSSLEIILGAKDFTDFLDKLQLVEYVSNHDENLISEVKEQLNAIADEKKALEDDKAAKVEEQTTLESKQEELNTLLEENKEVLATLQGEASDAQMKLELNEDQLSGLSADIQEYYRQQREAAAAAAAAAAAQSSSDDSDDSGSSGGGSSSSYDSYDSGDDYIDAGGGWVWPCSGVITSQFHEGRSYEWHDAIDIGAPVGTPIYAANSGTVVNGFSGCSHYSSWCSCGGGYGNFIWILHDNGYETIYGHMSQTAVSVGQRVSAGQKIGYVGSTGWS